MNILEQAAKAMYEGGAPSDITWAGVPESTKMFYRRLARDAVSVALTWTAENGMKTALMGEFFEVETLQCECGNDDPECEFCDGAGEYDIKVDISWCTIKGIAKKSKEVILGAQEDKFPKCSKCGEPMNPRRDSPPRSVDNKWVCNPCWEGED